MDWANFLTKLGVRSSVLWGLGLGSALLLFIDKFVSPLGLPQDWKWVLPVVVVISWAILLTGLVSVGFPFAQKRWKARQTQKLRDDYAVKNLEIAGDWQRRVLMHYKGKNQQRFRARGDADSFKEMVRQGLLINDSLDRVAWTQHYKVVDVVWSFLDNPPEDWAGLRRLEQINWE